MPLPSGPTPAPTREQLLTLLRGFLVTVLPTGVEVVIGQANRVPEPSGPDYVVLTSVGLRRLATTVDTWDMGDPAPSTLEHEQDVAIRVQMDVHGPNSTDNVNIITTLLRSDYGVEFFGNSGMSPLTCDDGNQIPFTSGERQFEDRWVVEALFQMNVVVATTQQFADRLNPELVNVDTLYPP